MPKVMPKFRWTMIFMGCAANAINYIDRANLAVAAPTIRHELGIDATVMGVILGAFFWTYAVMQMPFGWFADRVGARIALAARRGVVVGLHRPHRHGPRRRLADGIPTAAGHRRGGRLPVRRQA